MSYVFKSKTQNQEQSRNGDSVAEKRKKFGFRPRNDRNNTANTKGGGDFSNKHHEPRYAIHEIPRIINLLGKTYGFYEEASAWERYLNHYRNYERLMSKYLEDKRKFDRGLTKDKPRRPTMPAEPDASHYAANRPVKPYKKPFMYQGVSLGPNPHVPPYGSTSAVSNEPELVEVEKLPNVRGVTMNIPAVEIPAELSDYLEIDSEPVST